MTHRNSQTHPIELEERLALARNRGTRLFRAPGRINIIGEHTDYSGGLVLPVNTGLYTWVEAKARTDRTVHALSENLAASDSFELDGTEPGNAPDWIDYVRGVAGELRREGIRLTGIDLRIDGEIPVGRGLSSSASLEVSLALAMLAVAGESLPVVRVAEICQRAERRYAGVNCGIMDQFSVAGGRTGQAMLLDCRSLETRFVALPAQLAMIVTDSGVRHEHPESGYNDRHEECARAVRLLRKVDDSIETLRDVSADLIEDAKDRLGNTLFRRSRHVVTENARVIEASRALDSGDLASLGELVSASHRSLRDDFEVSCDEIDTLVAIADETDGVLGSRMMGGGFGGCVLSITSVDKADSAVAAIRRRYARLLGRDPWVHAVTPAAIAGEVTTT